MDKFGFVGATYQSLSPNVDAEDTINCYPEKIEGQGETPLALYGSEGLEIFVKINETSVPKIILAKGRTFAASSHLWELFETGPAIDRGDLLGPPVVELTMVYNPNQLLICNNGKLFVFTFATNVLVPVVNYSTGGAIPPVSQVAYTDGYFLATLRGTNSFQTSLLVDGTQWSALDIASISIFADPIVSMIIAFREPWFFGPKQTAVYYNSGAGDPPFIPIAGASLENGSGAQAGPVRIDNSIFWVDSDERGSLIARRANGYNPVRISNHAVETAWQSYSKTSDLVSYAYQINGHSFWMIYFPSADVTWCYDVSTQMWHKRGFWNGSRSTYGAHRSQCHQQAFGKHLVGDWGSGNIYNLSPTVYTDFGNPIRRLRRSPHVSTNQTWIYHRSMQLYCESGLGPIPPLLDGNGQPRAPIINLAWSDDGGHKYSSEHPCPMGKGGEYNSRVVWRRLGRSKSRVYQVTFSDPAPFRIVDAYLIADGG